MLNWVKKWFKKSQPKQRLGRMLLSKAELPSGTMSRYVRDIYYMSKSELTFEEFEKEYWENNDRNVEIRNREHPVEYDETFDITPEGARGKRTVHIFKRSGEDWNCSECDMDPYGGSSDLSLEEAKSLIRKTHLDACLP